MNRLVVLTRGKGTTISQSPQAIFTYFFTEGLFCRIFFRIARVLYPCGQTTAATKKAPLRLIFPTIQGFL